MINARSLHSHKMDYIIERKRKLDATAQADAVDWIRAVRRWRLIRTSAYAFFRVYEGRVCSRTSECRKG